MKPYLETPSTTLYLGDALEVLKQLPDASVQTCVTSPPYWGLRNYGVAGQLGLEESPEEFTCRLVATFREVRRVLRDDGTLWLNLGDSYAGSGKGQNGDGSHNTNPEYKQASNRSAVTGGLPIVRSKRIERGEGRWGGGDTSAPGLAPKNLVGVPWRVAFALQDDGWILRSDIIWSKSNPFPESVEDRPTKAHEYLFLLAKSPRYYYDAEAIKEKKAESSLADDRTNEDGQRRDRNYVGAASNGGTNLGGGQLFRNKRTVWELASEPYKGAHFATFPTALVEPCILAGTSEAGACAQCGAPWRRIVGKTFTPQQDVSAERVNRDGKMDESNTWAGFPRGSTATQTKGWEASCKCASGARPCVVLDIFTGSGTTNEVAMRLGRKSIGIDLNPKYLALAEKRIAGVPLPLTLLAPEQKGK